MVHQDAREIEETEEACRIDAFWMDFPVRKRYIAEVVVVGRDMIHILDSSSTVWVFSWNSLLAMLEEMKMMLRAWGSYVVQSS